MSEKLTVLTKWLKQRPVAAISIGLIILFSVVLFLRGSRLDALLEEQVRTDDEWSRIELNLRRARDLETHVERIQALQEEIETRLINPAEVALNYDYFYQIERNTGVRIVSINQIGTVDGRNAAGLPALKSYSAVGYTLSVEGGFPEVLDFLSAVTHGRFLTRISALNLSASNQANDRIITANLQCQILGVPNES